MSVTEKMSLADIGNELVAGCREGRVRANLDRLYSPDAVSVEAMPMEPGGSAETRGLDGIKGKHDWWDSTFEMTGGSIEGPFPHQPDRFAVIFKVDTKHKETGETDSMSEVAVYTVKDGQIVREEFFYGT